VDQVIEVRYAGVVIGRAPSVAGADAHGVSLGLADPMPVGTKLSVRIGEDVVEGRVEQVSESGDPAKSGMRIRFDDPSALSLFGVPGAPARVSAARPAATDEVVSVASAPAPVGEDDAAAGVEPQDMAAGDGDRATAPDQASSGAADDHGGQPGGGGRRRRRRR